MADQSPKGALTGFGVLKRLARRRRAPLVGACVCSALSAAFGLGPALALYGMAATALGEETSGPGVVACAILGLFCVTLHALLAAAANVLGHKAAFSIERELRAELLAAIERAPLGRTEGRAGEIKKTFMADVDRVEGLLAHVLPDLAAGVAAPVVGAALLFWVDWRMALAALALLPVAYAAQLWTYRGRRADLIAAWARAEGEANAAMLSYVRGVATLKAFDRQASTLANVASAVHALRDLAGAITRGARYPYALFHAALSTNLVIVLPAGLALRQTGAIGGAELVLALALGAGLTAPLLKAAFASMIAERARASLDRAAALLDAPVIDDGGGNRLGRDSTIRFEGVGFTTPDGVPILSDVTFEIPEGKVTAIVGPSGAGKTTLIRLLPRLEDCTAGRITVGGVDIRSAPLQDLRDRIALVAQDALLFRETVEENVRIARPPASEADLAGAIRKARADLLTPAASAGDRGRGLSGGERQRVAIARAILKDAPILILDEATSYLDAENEADVQAALSAASAGRTLLVVAHRLASIERADQIVVIDAGRVEAVGTHAGLLAASATYARLHRAQSAAGGWRLRGARDGMAAE